MWCPGGGTEAALGKCAVLEARHHAADDERTEDGVPRLRLAASAGGGLASPLVRCVAVTAPHARRGARHARALVLSMSGAPLGLCLA